MTPPLTTRRARALFQTARQKKILVTGDVMLDQFLWGNVTRISPEAPVPVVEFQRESFMPGGAANVARNLAALGAPAAMHGIVGRDDAAKRLNYLLKQDGVDCRGLGGSSNRKTSCKTRIIAQRQQVVRVDRESSEDLGPTAINRLLRGIEKELPNVNAVIVGDYGKGVVTQGFLDGLRDACQRRGVWLSLDPKPSHSLELAGLSLITPNRKEAFELAGVQDRTHAVNPMKDSCLMKTAERLLEALHPEALLITLGELGMLLCRKRRQPFHIPTQAHEVYDVSGAGDTVIAVFTAAVTAGASPPEAAVIANHAAGVVVGKLGTATASGSEILERLKHGKQQ